jgi:3-dehydroquinate dehydratase-1
MRSTHPIQLRGRPIGSGAYPLVITPLVGRNVAAIDAELQSILPRQPDMLEWRVDAFEGIADTASVLATAGAIKQAAGDLPLLMTLRSAREGGRPVPLDEAAVLGLLCRVCESGCVDLVDYELSNAAAHLQRLREVSARHGVAMVMSYHDFERTPDLDTLLGRFAAAVHLGADVAKVAVMPRDPQDVLTLLAATDRASQLSDTPLISISMGALGVMTRIMGWMYGSGATFAVGSGSSAPGQLGIEELRAALATVQRATDGA